MKGKERQSYKVEQQQIFCQMTLKNYCGPSDIEVLGYQS